MIIATATSVVDNRLINTIVSKLLASRDCQKCGEITLFNVHHGSY